MDIETYLEESAKTLAPVECFLAHVDEVQTSANAAQRVRLANLIHAEMGITTEVGELCDQVKRYIFYQQEFDVTNLEEEIGDIMWYVAILLRDFDLDFGDILDRNIRKLRKRFPNKFQVDNAVNRDLEAERKELET